MARLKKKKEKKGKLGSGKPYDGCSEVEVTLVIPVVSWGWRRDEGEEEERIRTVRQLRKPRLRLKQKRSACRRNRQSNSPLRKPSERRRRNASGRSL